ncbi:MAG: hypothetical protein Q7V05_12830 [Methanoregula sp.]|nr:hypothetical protein [Methanoregula sp.]
MDYDGAINSIISFKKSFEALDIEAKKKEKVPKKLVSELGEFYVLRELNRQQFKGVEPKGGQGKFDIKIGKNRIEVKTSLPKNDGLYDKKIEFYGWTVKRTNKSDDQNKDEQKFNFLIGVALDHSWENPDFYVFTFEEAYSNNSDVKIARYPSIRKKLHLFLNEDDFNMAKKICPYEITDQEYYFNHTKSVFLDAWDKLKTQN